MSFRNQLSAPHWHVPLSCDWNGLKTTCVKYLLLQVLYTFPSPPSTWLPRITVLVLLMRSTRWRWFLGCKLLTLILQTSLWWDVSRNFSALSKKLELRSAKAIWKLKSPTLNPQLVLKPLHSQYKTVRANCFPGNHRIFAVKHLTSKKGSLWKSSDKLMVRNFDILFGTLSKLWSFRFKRCGGVIRVSQQKCQW